MRKQKIICAWCGKRLKRLFGVELFAGGTVEIDFGYGSRHDMKNFNTYICDGCYETHLEKFVDLTKIVEITLREMDKSVFSIDDVKKKLPKYVNQNTLPAIINQLQKNNKIFISARGITWIENSNPNLKRAIAKRVEVSKRYKKISIRKTKRI